MPSAVVTGTSWKRRLLLLLVIAAAVYGCGQWWTARAISPPAGNTPSDQLALADFYAKLGNWDAAGPIFHRLEAVFKASGDQRNALYAHVSALEADIETVNLQRVSDELAAILARPELQRDLDLKQRCLEVKGNVDLNRDGLSARPFFEDLERVATLRHDKDAASRASGELGILAFLQGNSLEALKRVVGACAKATLSGDVGAQIRYLSLLGQGMAENHGASEALLVLKEAISIAKHTPGAGFPKIAVSGSASALTQLGRFAEAHQIIELGLAYARQHQYVGYQVDILAASGQLARAEGNESYAIAQYEEAAALARVIHFNRGLAEVNAQLASLYRIAGNLQKAQECARECIRAHREMGEVYQLPEHLAIEGEIESAAGDISSAEHTFQTAERIVGTMLANTPTPGIKRAVISAMSEVFVGHFSLEIKQHDFVRAYDVVEEVRGRVAADKLWAEADARLSRPPSVITDGERKLALLQIRLWDVKSDTDQEKLSNLITNAENQLSVPARPPLENASWRRPSLAELQKVLAPREALLEYVVGDDGSYCLAVSATHVDVFPLPPRKAIDALVDRYVSVVKKEKDAKSEGRALYSAILKPILARLAAPVLIIVPDGTLHRIPFAGLADDQGRYLLETRTITYAPSGTVFALLRSRNSIAPREMLAVGDVDYGGGIVSTATSVLFRGVKELQLATLPNLPGSADEVEAIQSALKDMHGAILSHANATETNFKRDASKPLSVIHLAVHALADTKYPDRAALVLAPDPVAGEDGLLQVREIRTLPISGTKLVTLSACDTSVGRMEGEEGVSSIVYAFLYAGARSAVATYWNVEDTATTDLMKAFYSELGRGKTKAEALRSAQLQLAHSQTEMRRPFFWAAFSLMGEGSDTI